MEMLCGDIPGYQIPLRHTQFILTVQPKTFSTSLGGQELGKYIVKMNGFTAWLGKSFLEDFI